MLLFLTTTPMTTACAWAVGIRDIVACHPSMQLSCLSLSDVGPLSNPPGNSIRQTLFFLHIHKHNPHPYHYHYHISANPPAAPSTTMPPTQLPESGNPL
jgi:hypothetical protein